MSRNKKMPVKKLTRRDALRHGMHFSLAGATLLGLGACGKSEDQALVCNEPGQLSDSDVSMRTSLGYADVSPNPAEVCGGCQYFTAEGSGGGCGSCQLLPGQVSSKGRCNSWSAKS
jgi:hypothetical protein